MAAQVKSPTLTDLVSSYAILPTLASWISTLDLYHLALTNRTNLSYILASQKVFKVLIRQSLCDGHGLATRQEFRHPYNTRRIFLGREDEPIEVRLYNVKCDEAGALPCIECGINICEECRYYPRIAPNRGYPDRRPHLNSPQQLQNIMCLCPRCDTDVEKSIEGKQLNELCDCDAFTRWICVPCKLMVDKFSREIFDKQTDPDFDWAADNRLPTGPTKFMMDHQCEREFWCSCGATVPQDTRPRCTWCKRRHLPEADWWQEYNDIGSKMPWFDNDPDYPHWVTDAGYKYPVPYPRLGYMRPGDDVTVSQLNTR